MMTFDVVYAIDDISGDYTQVLATSIVSICKGTTKEIIIHVFHDVTFSTELKQYLLEVTKSYNQRIIFHEVALPENIMRLKMICKGYLSKAALYRLMIADILPKCDMALYLDCDTLINFDISELFIMDFDDKLILAIHDEAIEKNYKYMRTNMAEFKIDNYFNSGVILFDLKKVKEEHNLLNECYSYLEKYDKDPFSDQSALNFVFNNQVKLISDIYNKMPLPNSDINDAKVWHFCGANKPWKTRYSSIDDFWWDCYRETPWGKNIKYLFYKYSKVVDPLDVALLTYPSGKKKKFFKNIFIRLFREIKDVVNNYV